MIFIGGASGTGKTTAIERFVARHPDFIHLRASKILSDRKRPVQNLSFTDLEENQLALKDELLALNLTPKTILDGHATIPVSGAFFNLSASFFDGLPLSALVFLWTDSNTLLQRRGIVGDAREMEVIEQLQEVERQQMRMIANQCDCPFYTMNTMDVDVFEKTLLKRGDGGRNV